jgi:branched-chain amino acid transport system permease protein
VFALTWAVGVTCVGVAGVLLAPIYPVYPTVGLQFVLIAYVTVVLGGLGEMGGALVASLIVAAVEVVGSYLVGTAWKEVLYLLLFIGILIVRPAGLFGQRGAEALGT